VAALYSDYELDTSGAYEHYDDAQEQDEPESDHYRDSARVVATPPPLLNYTIITTTLSKYKIGNTLKPFTYYEFGVSAANSLGESQTSTSLIVRTASTSI
jgi:hypothetical protein